MVDSSARGHSTADVVVIGAGMAGLAAAVAASGADRDRRVVVLDAREPGGRARTDQRGGFTFNRGAHALYRGGAAHAILGSLGIDVDSGGQPAIKGAMGRRDGQLHLLPQGPASGVRSGLVGVRDIAQLGAVMAKMGGIDASGEAGHSLDDWIARRRLRPAVAEMVRMIARVATYANAPDLIDAGAALGNIRIALDPGVQYLDGGFQSLVDGLLGVLAERRVEVRTGADDAVRGLDLGDPTGVTVETATTSIAARSVVLAAGGPDIAARLLGGAPAGWERLGPSPTAACLELGVRRPPAHRVVFGVDEPTYLSTHCPPADLAPPGQAVVHVMRYQPVDDALSADEQRRQLYELAAAAGIATDDIVEERFLAHMVVTGPMPVATNGGLSGRPAVDASPHPAVLLAGDWVGPTGLLTDAAVASGTEAGRLAVARADRIAAVA